MGKSPRRIVHELLASSTSLSPHAEAPGYEYPIILREPLEMGRVYRSIVQGLSRPKDRSIVFDCHWSRVQELGVSSS